MSSAPKLKLAQRRKKSAPAKVAAGGAPFKISLRGIQIVNGEMKQRMEAAARNPHPRKRRHPPIVLIDA